MYYSYNKTIKQAKELTTYLIELKNNWVSISVIEKIIYDKYISEKIGINFKKKHDLEFNGK